MNAKVFRLNIVLFCSIVTISNIFSNCCPSCKKNKQTKTKEGSSGGSSGGTSTFTPPTTKARYKAVYSIEEGKLIKKMYKNDNNICHNISEELLDVTTSNILSNGFYEGDTPIQDIEIESNIEMNSPFLIALNFNNDDEKNITFSFNLYKNGNNVDFSGCKHLILLKSGELTNINWTFNESIEQVKFRKEVNLSKVTSMNGLFKNCINLIEVNFDNCSTPQLTSIESMFEGCEKLKEVDMSEIIDCGNLRNIQNLFNGCKSLTYGTIPSKFTFTKDSLYEGLFKDCSQIKNVHFDNVLFEDGCNLENIFDGLTAKFKIFYCDLDKIYPGKVFKNHMSKYFNDGKHNIKLNQEEQYYKIVGI